MNDIFKNLNHEEILIGALIPFIFFFWLGWFCLGIIPLTSFCYALSGENGFSKIWRRLGVPLIIAIALALMTSHVLILWSVIPAFCVLSLGYGLPSTQPPDEGSMLGRFWFNILKENIFWANVWTRGTIFFLFFLSFYYFLIRS